MSKEITWEEALKKRYSEKSEKKNEDTKITGFKREFNFKRMNTTKKENKYYHTELLELDSKKILKNVTERKKGVIFQQVGGEKRVIPTVINGEWFPIAHPEAS